VLPQANSVAFRRPLPDESDVIGQLKQSVNILVMNHQLWSPNCDHCCAVCLHVAAITRTIDRLEGRI